MGKRARTQTHGGSTESKPPTTEPEPEHQEELQPVVYPTEGSEPEQRGRDQQREGMEQRGPLSGMNNHYTNYEAYGDRGLQDPG